MKLKATIVLVAMLPLSALAYCPEPQTFHINTPQEPRAPYCVNEYLKTHTCDDWVIESYYRDVETYQREVRNFIDDLNEYLSDAQNYVECRVEELD